MRGTAIALLLLGVLPLNAQTLTPGLRSAFDAAPSETGTADPGAPGESPFRNPAAPDMAFAAFQRGRFVTALREALARVAKDDADAPAMTLIGQLYNEGLGVRRDYLEASRWFRLAADRGDRQAMFALALLTLEGKGTPKSVEAARALFEKAAALGHAGAWYNLGVMALDLPNGADFTAAAQDFRAAADGGNADGAYSLGLLYREGKGVEQDRGLAASWLRRAAEGDSLGAQIEYGIALYNGDGVKKDEAAGFRLLMKAAARNNPVAQNRVARVLATGKGAPKDTIEAMKYHLMARAAGVPDEWLDQQLAAMSGRDKLAVEAALKKYIGE